MVPPQLCLDLRKICLAGHPHPRDAAVLSYVSLPVLDPLDQLWRPHHLAGDPATMCISNGSTWIIFAHAACRVQKKLSGSAGRLDNINAHRFPGALKDLIQPTAWIIFTQIVFGSNNTSESVN